MIEVYDRGTLWGSVTLVNETLQIDGPEKETLERLVESLRVDRLNRLQTDTQLYASLPSRLHGMIYALESN